MTKTSTIVLVAAAALVLLLLTRKPRGAAVAAPAAGDGGGWASLPSGGGGGGGGGGFSSTAPIAAPVAPPMPVLFRQPDGPKQIAIEASQRFSPATSGKLLLTAPPAPAGTTPTAPVAPAGTTPTAPVAPPPPMVSLFRQPTAPQQLAISAAQRFSPATSGKLLLTAPLAPAGSTPTAPPALPRLLVRR